MKKYMSRTLFRALVWLLQYVILSVYFVLNVFYMFTVVYSYTGSTQEGYDIM